MKERGQVLIGVIVLLVVLTIIVPAMILYVQNEARWSNKSQQNTNAFQLAEAAVERGISKITESTSTWANMQRGVQPANYGFNKAFADIPGGDYSISVTSGPKKQQVTVIGVGRDQRKKETRAIKAVYENMVINAAIAGGSGVTVNDGNVEWGAVISPKDINATGRDHPQFYSAGNIIGKDLNGPTPPNTDSVQWWSYYPGIPNTPALDFDAYKASAQATGTYFSNGAGQCGAYLDNVPGALCSGFNGPEAACKGYTWYFDCAGSNVNISSNGNKWIVGTVIVIGDFSVDASAASGNYYAKIPGKAWKQYGTSTGWTYYQNTWDSASSPRGCTGTTGTAPATYSAAKLINYSAPADLKCQLTNVGVTGFLYVSGNGQFGTGGAGLTQINGSAYIVGSVTLLGGSTFEVDYDPTSAQDLLLSRIYVVRNSWEDVVKAFPLP